MKTTLLVVLALLGIATRTGKLAAQVPEIGDTGSKPIPEMKKLYDALGGDWDTSEKRERTKFFPNGGERRGTSHVRLAAGGAMLVMEGQSDGSAGPLNYIIVIWWDKDAQNYGYFTCFKAGSAGCEIRGTAHWEGDKFVNDYYETEQGKKFKFRDTFEDITPNSHALVFAWIKDDGTIEPQIISKAVRRSGAGRP